MALPGKLCIGILEEDNPLKSYFRFKPLLIEADGRYIPYTELDAYPQDGCIRIVPDKNESYHFKARMRRIGLFCVVDLRAHPEDNDKIRPNKNYHDGTTEQNAFIIYSDVVREPAPEMIFEILPESAAEGVQPAPRTAGVLLRGEALHHECYGWSALDGDETHARLTPTQKSCPVEQMQTFRLNAFGDTVVEFAIVPPGNLPRISDAPPSRPARPAEAASPAVQKPEAPAPTAPAPPQPPEAPAPEAPAPPQPPEAPAPTAPAPPQPPEPPAPGEPGDKPWICRDDSMLPQPPDPRLSPAQRSLAIQSGLNPRRGRSLQELIDEKWQRSRLNQLGQPVTPIQTGAPVASPVDSAVSAVREVWRQPQLRQGLLESLSGIDEFGASLEECRAAARSRDIEQHLEGLEARRLALLGELDHLSQKSAEVRKALKQEVRRDEAADLAEAVRRTEEARAELARCQRLAADARAAAQDARTALDAMTGEALERQLTQFVLNGRMLERLEQLRGEAEAVPPVAPSIQSIPLNAMAVRVMNRFDASGVTITRAEALNLCACVAVSPVLILSGPVGCGKTQAARLLAEAFGWTTVDRFVTFAPGEDSLAGDARLDALDRLPNTPAMLLLDDANLYPAADELRGLEARMKPQWRLCLTVQDDGCPLSARALDRGFTMRLGAKPGAPWRPRAATACAPEAPASPCLEIPDAALPAAAEARMDALREGLFRRGATISRRALNDAWRYCALTLSALGESADPLAVLDRAVAQRLLPPLLASAPAQALAELPVLLQGLPVSRALLDQSLPVRL